MNIEAILGPDGLLAEKMPGYEYRPQQVEAASAVTKALKAKRHCLVEAGTGVGKSIAYLVPAIAHAVSGKKVVISTHTLYLQTQLLTKDIPFLQEVLPDSKFKAVLAKGRSNYLCLNNFDAELSQLYLLGDRNLSRLQKWASKTETGDVAELNFSLTGWGDICSNQDNCRRNNCKWLGKCFYYKMRKAAAEADIIVTNHSLFFSDLAIRSVDPNAGILPDYSAVILDEAHHLEDVATKAFGVEFSTYVIPHLLTRISRTRGISVDPRRLQTIEDLNNALFAEFSRSHKQEYFFSDVLGPDEAERTNSIASSLSTALEGLSREISQQETTGQPELAERLDGLRQMCTRLREEILLLFFGPSEGYFRWGEKSKAGRETRISLKYSPLSVSPILRDALWDMVDTAILTSATLSNSGEFEYTKSRLGLDRCIEAIEDSPFDFANQCLLYVPRHLEFPSESQTYADRVADEVAAIVQSSQGRAFVLFTSYRMLNAVYDRLAGRLPFVMMKQGDMSNEVLIQEFLKNDKACLFGVHSFWEGVDIRGDALSCVIIDKLPFAVPDSPIHRARVDAITAAGGDWFREYSMPQAQMRLKQGFGRLIRTGQDRGVVAILDSRLLKKFYGKEFLRFLPQCPVTFKMDDVAQFYENKNVKQEARK